MHRRVVRLHDREKLGKEGSYETRELNASKNAGNGNDDKSNTSLDVLQVNLERRNGRGVTEGMTSK